MGERVLVSVVMITYGHEKYIRQAIEGVLMQQGDFDLELVIANDCSPDNTDAVVQDVLSHHSNAHWIRYVRHEKNIGMMPNFIFALQQAKGNYIALCEGDDFWTDPLKLQKQVDFLEENEEYGFCFTRFQSYFQNKGIFKADQNGRYFPEKEKYIDFDFETFGKGWHIGTQTILFKTKLFNNANFSKYKTSRDIYLFTELLLQQKGACLSDFCAVYRIQDGGVYNSLSQLEVAKTGKNCYQELSKKNKEIAPLRSKYKSFFNRYINELIAQKKTTLAIKESFIFFFEFKDLKTSKKHFKKILKQLKKMIYEASGL